MTSHDRATLKKQLHDRPDDEEILRVYAECLQQEGDPRGEFIAVQLKLDEARKAGNQDSIVDLESREAALWQAHWGALVQEDLFDHFTAEERSTLGLTEPSRFTYRKGQLYGLRFGGLPRPSSDVIVATAKLVASASCLRNLRELCVQSQSAKPWVEALAASTTLTSLKRLTLRCTDLGPRGAKALAESGLLRNLEALAIPINYISNTGAKALAGSDDLHLLEELCLDTNELTQTAGVSAIAKSTALTKLRVLSLRDERIGAGAVKAVMAPKNLPSLQHLDLERAWIGAEAGAKAIATSKKCASLKTLNLGSTHITEAGLKVLGESPHLGHLEVLNLGFCNAKDEGIVALAEVANFGKLSVLNLDANLFGAAGAQAFAQSAHFESLEELSLCGNNFGDDGAKALANAAHLGNLVKLHLHNTGITKVGLEAIARSKSFGKLRLLGLAANRIEQSAVDSLRDAGLLDGVEVKLG